MLATTRYTSMNAFKCAGRYKHALQKVSGSFGRLINVKVDGDIALGGFQEYCHFITDQMLALRGSI